MGPPGTTAQGYEDLVSLAKSALPDPSKDHDGKVAELVGLYKSYLRSVAPDHREALVLAEARYALTCARESGRPSLGSYACKIVMGTLVPKLLELCHEDFPSYSAVVLPCHDNGLFANVLQVCDALLLSRQGTEVLVDWRRGGSEAHFQYGPSGFDLFTHLFQPDGPRCRSLASGPAPEGALTLKSRISPFFLNMLRGYFWTFPELQALRQAYSKAMACLQPSQLVLDRVDDVCALWGEDDYVVGVHRRLGTSEVAACQLTQRNPAHAEYIERARRLALAQTDGRRPVIFLATDDLTAVQAFEAAFPPTGDICLAVRPGVKRSAGGVRADGVDDEVHRSPCEAKDAEDALVDALCLARCEDLVCIDSNVSIFAALMNPELRLHPLNSILPEGWEAAASKPAEKVYKAYRVAYKPMVFIRGGPSAACELKGAKKHGEVVETSGRGFDGWVELKEGGWMLVDGERQAQSRGAGKLLEPVEEG